MHRADKAVLRLAVGTGLSVVIAYGFSLPMAFAVCVLAILALAKPGPPMPFVKGLVSGLIIAGVVVAGVLMVPLLQHYPMTAVALTATLLFGVFFAGARSDSPITIFLVIALTFIPVAGTMDQALTTVLAQGVGLGLIIGALVNGVSHAFFPDPPQPAKDAAPAESVSAETARWQALQSVVVIMPVFVLALTNPPMYVAAIMKTVMLSKQASATNAHSAGRELVGSTAAGAVMALVVWFGLSMLPTLWMLTLWIVAASLWTGVRMFGIKPTSFPPSFWLNAIMTMLILLGPAIEDARPERTLCRLRHTRVALHPRGGLRVGRGLGARALAFASLAAMSLGR
jgi:hypothetical protein